MKQDVARFPPPIMIGTPRQDSQPGPRGLALPTRGDPRADAAVQSTQRAAQCTERCVTTVGSGLNHHKPKPVAGFPKTIAEYIAAGRVHDRSPIPAKED